MKIKFRIGTRASPLALAQTNLLIAQLRSKHPQLETETVTITTSGDKTLDRGFGGASGKNLFTKEIEEALLAGTIDCAVHSMKDMPTTLPDGLIIGCLLPREDPRDAFFSNKAKTLDDLPPGATVGTASLRRQAIILARRPDLKVKIFRGNVGTRLKKLQDGEVDATVLAVAGMKRLGHAVQTILEPDVMLPAVAQGAIGVEARADDKNVLSLLSTVHCCITELRVTAERAFLGVMDGSCKTPLAALMSVPDASGNVTFDVLVARPDGTDVKRASHKGSVKTTADAEALGKKVGIDMKAQLPPGYMKA